MKNQTITDRITWLRHTLGATQAGFWNAAELILRHCAVSSGARHCETPKYYKQIANALQIDPGWLLTGDARYLALLPANQSSALFANAGIQMLSFEKTFFNIYPHLQP